MAAVFGRSRLMNPDLERLIRLQDLESTAEAARRALAEWPARLEALDARLADAQRAVDEAKKRLADSQHDRRALEKDAAAQQARLTKFKDQSGSVKTNKEYQALLHEIGVAKQELDAIEEKILGHMEVADTLAADVKNAEAALAAAKKQDAADRQALDREFADLERQLADALATREDLTAHLDHRLVSTFETLSRGRKGIGVAVVTRDGLCSGCHVRLRPHLFALVRQNDEILQCESCQRILYWVPPTMDAPSGA